MLFPQQQYPRASVPFAQRMWGSLQPSNDTLPDGYRPILIGVLIACFVLRFGLAWLLPNIHNADEVYQVAEQANRSVHGFGIVPWEFRTASRGALFPTLVKPIYTLNASAETRQTLIAMLFTAVSLIPVWVAFHWIGRLYGLQGGLLAAVMMATSLELVYFAPKPSPDAVSGYFFLAALFLARPGAGAGAVYLAGLSLMLALGVRLQIAPAVGIALLLMVMTGGRRRTTALLAGLASGLVLVGAAEWLWWGVPFRGHWGYLKMEFVQRASTFFSREPVTFFVKNYVLMYGGEVPVVAFLVWAGARHAPILLLSALAIIVPFHLIGHKEYRFLIPSVPVLVLLIALAVADFLARLDRSAARRAALLVAGGWLISMVAMSLGDFYRPFWTRDRNHILAFREIGKQADACGVALVRIGWWHTPGYSGLGRDIPIYEMGSDDQAARIMAAANYVLVGPKAPAPAAPYTLWREYSRPVEHLYRRPGGCVPDESSRIVRPPGIPGLVE